MADTADLADWGVATAGVVVVVVAAGPVALVGDACASGGGGVSEMVTVAGGPDAEMSRPSLSPPRLPLALPRSNGGVGEGEAMANRSVYNFGIVRVVVL